MAANPPTKPRPFAVCVQDCPSLTVNVIYAVAALEEETQPVLSRQRFRTKRPPIWGANRRRMKRRQRTGLSRCRSATPRLPVPPAGAARATLRIVLVERSLRAPDPRERGKSKPLKAVTSLCSLFGTGSMRPDLVTPKLCPISLLLPHQHPGLFQLGLTPR